MPLSQKLGRPSRSYLSSALSDDGRSVTSNRDNDDDGSIYGGSIQGSQAGSYRGGILKASSSTNLRQGRSGAASDYGGGSRSRVVSSAEANRRSVTFSDFAGSMGMGGMTASTSQNAAFDRLAAMPVSNRLEVMSDTGGDRHWYNPRRKKTPSIAESVRSNDSDVSTMSRRAAKRGSRTDLITTPQLSQLWQNQVTGTGPGLIRRPSASGSIASNSGLVDSRKRTNSGNTTMSLLKQSPSVSRNLANAKPSRKYTLQPDEAAGVPEVPDLPSSISPSATLKQEAIQNERDLSSNGQVDGEGANVRKPGLERSSSSSGSVKRPSSKTASTQRSVSQPMPVTNGSSAAVPSTARSLHSSTLQNNLLANPAAAALASAGSSKGSKGKTRTPEQIVQALAKAGLLDRVMEVVQEADEEDEAQSTGRRSRSPSPAPVQRKESVSEATPIEQPAASQTDGEAPIVQLEPVTPKPAAEKSAYAPYSYYEQTPTVTITPDTPMEKEQGDAMQAYPEQEPAPTPAPQQVSPQVESAPLDEDGQAAQAEIQRILYAQNAPPIPQQQTFAHQSGGEGPEKAKAATEGSAPTSADESRSLDASATQAASNVTTPAPAGHARTTEALPTTTTSQLPYLAEGSGPALAPRKVTENLISAGMVPTPSSSSPLRVESLSVTTATPPQASVSRTLAGTALVLSSQTTSSVIVRLTWNGWANYEEVEAVSTDSRSSRDEYRRYNFSWPLPTSTEREAVDVQMALRLEAGVPSNQTYWDNNGGSNYTASLPALSGSRAGSPPRSRPGSIVLSRQSSQGSVRSTASHNHEVFFTPSAQDVLTSPLSMVGIASGTAQADTANSASEAPAASQRSDETAGHSRTFSEASEAPSDNRVSVYHEANTAPLPNSLSSERQGLAAQAQQEQAPSQQASSPTTGLTGLLRSEVPFPAPHRREVPSVAPIVTAAPASIASSSALSTPTASFNDDPRLSMSSSFTTPQQSIATGPVSAIPKHVLQEHPSADRMATPASPQQYDASESGNVLSQSRGGSVASRASQDSSNAPFIYPTKDSYAAGQPSLSRSQSLQGRGGSPQKGGALQQSGPSEQTPSLANGSPTSYSRGGTVTPPRLPEDEQDGSATPKVFQPTASANGSIRRPAGKTNGYAAALGASVGGKPFDVSTMTNGSPAGPTKTSTMRALTVTSNMPQTLGRANIFRSPGKKSRTSPSTLPEHLRGKSAAALNIVFSPFAQLPHKIRGDEALVQVFASAIDFWDRAKVDILASRGQGTGFIPGRSFVGRVVECGTDIDAGKLKKGDFVYGLLGLQKSGALGDYVAVNRALLTQAPNGVLSLEQIAAVALSGAVAYQAMDELCSTLPRGSKVLIMNAHEGVGALALQLSQSLRPSSDLWILAHYPADFSDGDMVLKALGANETLCGEPVSAIKSMRESTYDAVLDTIGGRQVYDAGKGILHDDGYFVTTVGDALSVPTAKAHWRKSFKALFKRNEKAKRVRYWFPSVEEDQRASLVRLREICEKGELKPVVKRVYKFEDGAAAFIGTGEGAVIMLLDQERLEGQ